MAASVKGNIELGAAPAGEEQDEGPERASGAARALELGELLASWDTHAGLGAALQGTLSAGLSGMPWAISPAGGARAAARAFGLLRLQRSPELVARWLEFAALASPSPLLARAVPFLREVGAEDGVARFRLEGAARAAALHRALWPLKRRVMAAGAAHGWPLARHMWLQYPQQAEARGPLASRQFMVGDLLLVCPVLGAGRAAAHCWLPREPLGWRRLGAARPVPRSWHGQSIRCEAPAGRPCVFVRGDLPPDCAGAEHPWLLPAGALATDRLGERDGPLVSEGAGAH